MDRFSTLITPRFNNSDANTACPLTSLTPKEFVETALGKKFTSESGIAVNNCYRRWVSNLNLLVQCGYINDIMYRGFLELNKYGRSENETENGNIIEDTTQPKTSIKKCGCTPNSF